MTQQLAASLFDESTQMYKDGNYSVCVALLNDCILLQPSLSILYSNRAISNFGLKEIDEALIDLQTSVQINHLNYIAYFNIFSINFQLQRQEPAFKNLCFSLSTGYTVLARRIKNEDWINQSLYYSFNNKESIFLKAMHKLEEKQYNEALNLLVQAQSLENQIENKQKLSQMVSYLQNLAGKTHNQLESISNNDLEYELKTSLECPLNWQQFQQKIEVMVKEFNNVNKLINKLQSQKTIETNTPTEKSIQNSQKMQKQTNCITIYESNLEQQSRINNEQDEQSQPQSRQDRLDKLNLYSTISEANQQDNSIQSKMSSYDLYPILKQGQSVSIFFEQATFIGQQYITSKYKNIYAVFHYESFEQQKRIIRTGNSKLKEGLCRWCQWSDQIILAKSAQRVSFTIFNTSFTSFEDKTLGYGQFQLDELGFISIPFTNNEKEYGGQLQMIIQKND